MNKSQQLVNENNENMLTSLVSPNHVKNQITTKNMFKSANEYLKSQKITENNFNKDHLKPKEKFKSEMTYNPNSNNIETNLKKPKN